MSLVASDLEPSVNAIIKIIIGKMFFKLSLFFIKIIARINIKSIAMTINNILNPIPA